jgi:hypothetical protein
MSAVMLAGQQLGWMKEQPPEALTEEALERADLLEGKPVEAVHAFAVASHFAFGAAGGATFGLLRWVVPLPPVVPTGIAFGLGIWGASYRGWIPAMNILPAEQHPGRRGTLVMIAAHAVYGATIGAMSRRAHRRGGPRWNPLPSPRHRRGDGISRAVDPHHSGDVLSWRFWSAFSRALRGARCSRP